MNFDDPYEFLVEYLAFPNVNFFTTLRDSSRFSFSFIFVNIFLDSEALSGTESTFNNALTQ